MEKFTHVRYFLCQVENWRWIKIRVCWTLRNMTDDIRLINWSNGINVGWKILLDCELLLGIMLQRHFPEMWSRSTEIHRRRLQFVPRLKIRRKLVSSERSPVVTCHHDWAKVFIPLDKITRRRKLHSLTIWSWTAIETSCVAKIGFK